MKKSLFSALFASAILVLGVIASGSAFARGGHYGHSYDHSERGNFGVFLGAPIHYPRYYSYFYSYPYYPYYPPSVVAVPSSPPVYVERSIAPSAPAPARPQGDWYYCANAKSYYPYVRDCPAGWQRVPAQPSR